MIIGLFVASVVALVAFVVVERRATEPVLPIRLFANPVFTVCCVLSFVVGFAMFGALTFLPTFMQFVDGVSATTSGLRTLPMVLGLLVTSLSSGVIVGRTGRYKIFPIAGTAVMAVGFVLLSRMEPGTSTLVQSLYLLVLGAGIGLTMQVLVLVVQNTVDFTDLGVATSGVTFFRTIGMSFGAAIFGSMFANFLGDRLPRRDGQPAAHRRRRRTRRKPCTGCRLSVAAPIINAYADSLSQVFLYAAPVAVVGFVLALFLKQVPLRDAAASGSTDMGEGFGMPTTESPEKLLEIAVGRLLQRTHGIDFEALAHSPRSHLDPAGAVGAAADLPARRDHREAQSRRDRRLPPSSSPGFGADVRPAGGHRLRDARGRQVSSSRLAGHLRSATRRDVIASWITETLAKSPEFEGRPERMQVQGALERVARGVLLERDGSRRAPRPVKFGEASRLQSAPTTRLHAPIGSGVGLGTDAPVPVTCGAAAALVLIDLRGRE